MWAAPASQIVPPRALYLRQVSHLQLLAFIKLRLVFGRRAAHYFGFENVFRAHCCFALVEVVRHLGRLDGGETSTADALGALLFAEDLLGFVEFFLEDGFVHGVEGHGFF